LPNDNVFFELGYLYHCYDLERVLIVKTEDAEICSDLNGVRYIADANLNQLINSLNALTQIEF
jgi:predicted nucleotide-binding protein